MGLPSEGMLLMEDVYKGANGVNILRKGQNVR